MDAKPAATDAWDLKRGLAAVSVAAVVTMPAVLVFVFIFDANEGPGILDELGGAVLMMMMYGIIMVPVMLLFCGAYFSALYFALRALGMLRRELFPGLSVAALLVVSFFSSSSPTTWRFEDWVGFIFMVPYSAFLGHVFAKRAAPQVAARR